MSVEGHWHLFGMAAADLTPSAEQLLADARERAPTRLSARERWTSIALGGGFLASAVPLAVLVDSDRSPSLLAMTLLLAAYAVASRIEFEVGAGSAVPTQLVLVPMLFILPPLTVPLYVAAGYFLGALPDHLRHRKPLGRSLVLLGCSWHALGPALVLALAGERVPSWQDWPLYVGALAAQFAFDFAHSAVHDWLAVGVSPRRLISAFAWVYVVDLLLAPLGLLAAFATVLFGWGASLLVLPLAGLLALFAGERKARLDHALELSRAYRGTALLLGDVIGADDAYTGSHSLDVVSLVLAVSEELGLDSKESRDAEFAALLHDIGKIRIPTELINKPGPLTLDERELMKTHTIEGEQLLDRIGGLLSDVGRIVRSCHEHYDGNGYPDGLRGGEIPLVARVVSCCDAFSAMTTTRSYRAAMPLAQALEELERHAGTQFDPDVVQALLRVVGRRALVRP